MILLANVQGGHFGRDVPLRNVLRDPTRRQFIGQATAWAAGLVLTDSVARAVDLTVPQKRKAAVIGHTGRGNYGHGLDLIFAGRPEIEVCAVADPDPAGRESAQSRCRAARSYSDYREMLERENPELVCVAPRWTDQHFAMVAAALRSGAHVFCEKPFTATLIEADELLALADRQRLKIAVAHQSRVAPSTLFLKRKLEEGYLGRLLEIRMHGKQDRRAGGEDMVVLGSHQFELARFFAGQPEWCTARILQDGREVTPADLRHAQENIGPIIGNDIDAMVAFRGGVNVRFVSRAAQAETAGPWGMEFIGSKGVIRLENAFVPVLRERRRRGTFADQQTDAWRPLEGDPATGLAEPDLTVVAGNRRVVDDWLSAIAHDQEPACSGRAATESLELIHGIFAAGLKRGRVDFPLRERGHPLAS